MSKFPKHIPPLTPEQKIISDDFMQCWHEELRKNFSIMDKFNHEYVVKNAPANFVRTLEIGAGLGEHLTYEKLSAKQKQGYVGLEIRENMAAEFHKKNPDIAITVADCQKTLPYDDDHFDRIIAIHVLEHLPNLPAAIKEAYRLCNKKTGTFSVVIPCEGGLLYSLARKISAQRLFEKRYKQSYQWFIEREHLSTPDEILEELKPYFKITHRHFFPFMLPSVGANLAIGLTLKPI